MNDPVTDLEEIKRLSKLNHKDFLEFTSRVKQIPVTKFDALSLPVVEEITSKIDCTLCGNCCKHQEPGVTNEEIDRLAKLKNISSDSFRSEYVAIDVEGVSFLCNQPCTFLSPTSKGFTVCSIYNDRPGSCADFPGLHRPRLKWRMKQVEENLGICPIVFNVVERLKGLI